MDTMSLGKTDAKAEALRLKLRGWYDAAVRSSAYMAWQAEAREAWRFYDGDQWTQEEIGRLHANGQAAIVINRIAAKVDHLTGVEVAGRTQISYRSRSGNAVEEDSARALTDVALWVSDTAEQAAAVSQVFKSGVVCGIGWLDVGLREGPAGADVAMLAEDEMSVVWDTASRKHDMGDARWVGRERWLSGDELEMLFGERARAVREALQGQGWRGAEGLRGNSDLSWVKGESGAELWKVVEMQYKASEPQWRLRLKDGRAWLTFDKGAVQELLKQGAVVEDKGVGVRVRVAYLSGDVLLDERPLAYDHQQFTLIPFVYKRHRGNGRPYGAVKAALDPQRELNKRRSKAMHLLNTAQVVADVDAVDDPAALVREAARPDGLILKRAGKDVHILRNTELAASQVGVMHQAATDIEEVLGLYDENMGRPSNAMSGVAIAQRQRAGSLTQMTALDGLRLLKKRLGEQVLALVRQFFSAEEIVAISDRMASLRALDVSPRDARGEPLDGDTLRYALMDVVVEEVPDVDSAREMDLTQLQMLAQAGVPIPPDVWVRASSVRGKEEILKALNGGAVGNVNQGK